MMTSLGVIGLCVVGAPHPVSPGAALPVPIGLLEPGVSQDYTVSIVSTESYRWKMPKHSVSCPACIDVLEAPQELLPGQTAHVRLRITPTDVPGPKRWGVALHGGGHPPLRIECEGMVQGLLVDPALLDLGRCARGVAHHASLALTWHGAGRIVQVQAQAADPDVQVQCVLPHGPGGGDPTCVVALRASQPRSVDSSVRISAIIDDGDTRSRVSVSVPLRAEVIDPSVSVAPTSIFLGSVASMGESVTSVHVRLIGGGTVTASSDLPGLRIKMTATDDRLRCDLCYAPPPAAKGLQRGVIHLIDEKGGHRVAAISVLVFVGGEF